MLYASVALRTMAGVVFLAAALSKCRSRTAFAEFRYSVAEIVPAVAGLATPVAMGVVATEWAVVVLLAVPPMAVVGFGLAAVSLTSFSIAIIGALRRQVSVACRCFGSSTRPLGRIQLLRNAILATVVLGGGVMAFLTSASPSTDVAVIAFAAGLGFGLVLMFLDELADLFTEPEPVTVNTSPRS